MTFQLHYLEDGDTSSHIHINEIRGFIQTIYLNYALDGETTTNQSNLDVDLFTSDTAGTKTNLTYSAVNDRYDCDTGAGTGTCTLITDAATVSLTNNSVVVKSNHTIAATTTLTTYVSFNNGTNWTQVSQRELDDIDVTGTQLKVKFVFSRADTNSTDYIEGYAVYYS